MRWYLEGGNRYRLWLGAHCHGIYENGEYLAASASHYSVGSYTQKGDNVEISADVKQYADLRTVFGLKTTGKLHVISKCKIKKDEMNGKSRVKGKKKHEILVHYTRLDTLD